MDGSQKDALRKHLGKAGEEMACAFLQKKGFRILGRNFHGGHAELDIVCADGADLRFVEVKTRREPVEAAPASAVDACKQRHLVSAAGKYLSSEEFRSLDFPRGGEMFFDVVTIVWNHQGTSCNLEYIPQAFIPIYT